MKKSLLISAGVLTLLGVSATLFAQTATGGSLITEMKASIRSFTLASDLNPGTTGLQSYPVAGKETGDMLTAGEWNRVLELLAQGGGGDTGGPGWVDVSTTDTADFDTACQYRFFMTGSGINTTLWGSGEYVNHATFVYPKYLGLNGNDGNTWTGVRSSAKTVWGSVDTTTGVYTPISGFTVSKIQKLCGGGAGGGGGSASSGKLCLFTYFTGSGTTFNSHAHALPLPDTWTQESCRAYVMNSRGGAASVQYQLGCMGSTQASYGTSSTTNPTTANAGIPSPNCGW